jgi:hypothetical protein
MQKNPEGILCKHRKKRRLECPYTYLSIAIAIRVRTLAVTVQMDISIFEMRIVFAIT